MDEKIRKEKGQKKEDIDDAFDFNREQSIAKKEVVEGTNGGELGDPDMYAEVNIEILLRRIGYRNVMSRQSQQLKEIMEKCANRYEREQELKKRFPHLESKKLFSKNERINQIHFKSENKPLSRISSFDTKIDPNL